MALRTGLTLREPTSKQLHLNVYSATRKRAERHLSRLWNGKRGCRKAGKSRLAKPVSDVPMDIDGATAPLVRNAHMCLAAVVPAFAEPDIHSQPRALPAVADD